MNSRRLFLLLVLTSTSLAAHAQTPQTFTYPQLVDRMTNMEKLSELPPVGETTSLASSYDRRSKYDAASDTYTGWDANGDGGGVIRKEGDNDILMDVQGPGVIWRTWSATAGGGKVKIYLDGSDTPAVDLTFNGYFDGKTAPFNRPNLVYVASQAAHGFDNYTPISFSKSCKIVGEKGWGDYYQFTYTLFPAGTVVPTFTMNLSADDSAALDRANDILGNSGQDPAGADTKSKTETKSITVEPGKPSTLVDMNGAGALTGLQVKFDMPKDPEEQRILLRQLTISITWDDDTTPSVWSPLGDFFGYVGGADTFQSLPVGLRPDGTFYSYWYMPYGKKAHVEIGNDGPAPVTMDWQVSVAPLTEPIANLARFHAKWHRDAFLLTRADRFPDWTLLTTQGRGRYVGTHLHGWNPRGGWWGEGDDKFFIDGEKFPSTFGTGSEDYFGYAWSSAGHFSRPYHNQILNEDNAGHFDDNRWHISDSVPFQTSFDGFIEKYFANSRPTLYAAEVFWYLNSGGTDPYTAVPVTDRVGYWVRPYVYKEPGVIEAESLHPTNSPGQPAGDQDVTNLGQGWSNNHQFFWKATDVSQTLELAVPEQTPGKYKLLVRYTKATDYGIVQANFNGVDVGTPTDLYSPNVVPGDQVDLGTVTVTADKSDFKLTVTGKNDASKGYFVGIDYLKLVPQ